MTETQCAAVVAGRRSLQGGPLSGSLLGPSLGPSLGSLSGPSQVFDFLQGEWTFERAVTQPENVLRICGTATISALESCTALYQESARVALPDGKTLHAGQRYRYERTEDGISILFHTTGALFQRLRFTRVDGELCASAVHVCARDLYSSRYALRSDGSFRVQHEVRGPRKRYGIETELRRVEGRGQVT